MLWVSNIKSLLRQMRMFLYWGWNLRNDVDYDANSVWHMLALKYKRTHEHMKHCRYMEWTVEGTKDMKRLATMAKIAERLAKDEDYDIDDSLISRYTLEEIPENPDFKRVVFHRTPFQKAQFLAAVKRMGLKRQYETDLFVKYFHKYNSRFWE